MFGGGVCGRIPAGGLEQVFTFVGQDFRQVCIAGIDQQDIEPLLMKRSAAGRGAKTGESHARPTMVVASRALIQ